MYLTKHSYPELIKNSYKIIKKKQTFRKIGKTCDRHFTKCDIQMAHNHLKRSVLTPLVIRKFQIKTIIQYYCNHQNHSTPRNLTWQKCVYIYIYSPETHKNMHSSTLFNSPNLETTPKSIVE